MSKSLNPQTICNLYTLAQIQTKVDLWLDKLERASTREYKKDTTQGMQQVESEELQRIESVLQSYLKALEFKKGLGKPHIISANFTSGRYY